MPEYQYLLNDAGKYSMDDRVKIVISSLHGVNGEPEDPRNFHPNFLKEASLTP